MNEFFANMDDTLRIYWYIAIGASVIFVFQTILSFMGSDAHGGMDTDIDTDGDFDDSGHSFHIFSFRNLINFLLGFSWSGIAFYNAIEMRGLLIFISIGVGVAFIFIFFLVMKVMMKLAENNSFDINNTINKTADVYLTIPANKSGKGKVLISVKGSVHELNAVTAHDEAIKSGAIVKVIAVTENQILIVEPA